MSERARAEREARVEELKASRARERPPVRVGTHLMTEDVVTVLDALKASMDWGSGFLDDQQLNAANRLMTMLKFDCEETYYTDEVVGWSRRDPLAYVNVDKSPTNPGGWSPVYMQEGCTKVLGHDGEHGQEER